MAQRFSRLCDPDADLPVQGFRNTFPPPNSAKAIGVSPRYLLQIGARRGRQDSSMWGMAQPAAISCHGRRLNQSDGCHYGHVSKRQCACSAG